MTDRPTATPDDVKPLTRPDGVEYIVKTEPQGDSGIHRVIANGHWITNIRQLSTGYWLAPGGTQHSLKDHAMIRACAVFMGMRDSQLLKWKFFL